LAPFSHLLQVLACVYACVFADFSSSVARSGQMGFHHRTEVNKKIFKIGKSRKTEEGKYVMPVLFCRWSLTTIVATGTTPRPSPT
jgi:ribosomal protein L3